MGPNRPRKVRLVAGKVVADPRKLSVVLADPLDVEQTHHEGLAAPALAVPHQLVDVALPAGAAVDEEVLEVLEALEVHVQLRLAPAGQLAHFTPREAVLGGLDRQPPRDLDDVAADRL